MAERPDLNTIFERRSRAGWGQLADDIGTLYRYALATEARLAAAEKAAGLVIDCLDDRCGDICMDCVAALVLIRGEVD